MKHGNGFDVSEGKKNHQLHVNDVERDRDVRIFQRVVSIDERGGDDGFCLRLRFSRRGVGCHRPRCVQDEDIHLWMFPIQV